jgi:Zn-dependent M28 family amino/carboxypeptidase
MKTRALWVTALAGGATLLAWGALSLTQQHTPQHGAIGDTAYEHVRALVALGPRPSGSEAHRTMQQYIGRHLETAGFTVEQDSFTAQTPVGAVPITNIIGRIGGSGGASRILVLASHYETKMMDNFVGANDSGSSTGLLLTLAPLLAKQKLGHELRLVFFDGEEAFQEWSETDSLYGSRHLAERWKAEGVLPRIGAFILLDMIGDASLNLYKDTNSTPWLRDLIWATADRLGYSGYFLGREFAYEDDHIPFVRAGVPSVDVIDLNYSAWHTPDDTLDKVSARSLQIVGEVILESLTELDRQR